MGIPGPGSGTVIRNNTIISIDGGISDGIGGNENTKIQDGPYKDADIYDNLIRPGRDPRDELPKPILRSDVLKMEDLREGMILKGIVRNVVDFGAFVDIGVKQDGLVHVSKMADRYVKNPLEVVSVGDVVVVKVISLDLERGRIGLSMKK